MLLDVQPNLQEETIKDDLGGVETQIIGRHAHNEHNREQASGMLRHYVVARDTLIIFP